MSLYFRLHNHNLLLCLHNSEKEKSENSEISVIELSLPNIERRHNLWEQLLGQRFQETASITSTSIGTTN